MAVRRDTVQLNIEFITDEARNLAKANSDVGKLTKELRKTIKNGGDVADVMRRISEAGAKVEDIDLTRVAPKQLITRARQLQDILGRLPSSAPGVAKLSAEYKRINDRLATIRKNSRGVASGSGGGLFGSLTAKATGLLAVLGTVVASVRGLFNFVSAGVGKAAAFEQLNVSLEVFLGSAEKAEQVIKDLNEFSISTPFETDQVNKAGRALLAFGFQQEDLIDILGKVGNVAAGTGKDFNELALIYGKARAAGRIQGEELNQLAEAGIPIYDELAKVLGVNSDEIRKLGEQGRLSFEDLEAVFTNLTAEGGQFNGLLEKQSTTLTGLASTARGAFSALQRNIGEAFLPLLKEILPPTIAFINRLVERVGPLAQAFGAKLVQAFNFVRTALQPVFAAFSRLGESISELGTSSEFISLTMRQLGAVFALAANLIASVVNRVAQLISLFSSLGGGEGGIIYKVFTSPFRFAMEILIQFVAVLNGLVSASRTVTDELQNVFGIFTDTIGLAINKVKGFFGAENEREIFEGEQRLAARFAASGRKIGNAFRQGYEDALGDLEVSQVGEPKQGRDTKDDTVTNPLAPKPLTEAQKKKEAERLAKERAEIERRAKNTAVGNILGKDDISDISRTLVGLGPDVDQISSDEAEIERAQQTADKLAEIDEALLKRKEELAEKEKQIRATVQEFVVGAATETTQALIDLLGRDEDARKKNASAIKGLQKAQVVIAGIQEVQQLQTATAAQAAAAGPLAPLVLALGGVRVAAAIARTAAQVAKISATKFARGGKVGLFGGRSHAAGGTQLYGDDGTHIEVEKDETFVVLNKNAKGRIRQLSDLNASTGGVPFFRDGGFGLNAPNTSPQVATTTIAASAAPQPDNSGFMNELRAVKEAIQAQQLNIVYTDLQEVDADVNAVEAAASV